MDSAPDTEIIATVGAAIASEADTHATVDAVVRRLTTLCDATVDLWVTTEQLGDLRPFSNHAPLFWQESLPVDPAAPARALATLKTVTSATEAIGRDTLTFIAVPLLAAGQARGVLLVRSRQADNQLLTLRPALEAAAPFLGLLLHTSTLETTERASGPERLPELYSRRYLLDSLDRELARARRTRSSCAILLVALDSFSALTHDYGPASGDRALQALAALLRACCRDVDTVGRYDNDRFLALLPGSDGRGAQLAADRLLGYLYRSPVTLPHDQAYYLRTSIGIACFPVDGFDADELLHSASRALLEAQTRGGNRTVAA